MSTIKYIFLYYNAIFIKFNCVVKKSYINLSTLKFCFLLEKMTLVIIRTVERIKSQT